MALVIVAQRRQFSNKRKTTATCCPPVVVVVVVVVCGVHEGTVGRKIRSRTKLVIALSCRRQVVNITYATLATDLLPFFFNSSRKKRQPQSVSHHDDDDRLLNWTTVRSLPG